MRQLRTLVVVAVLAAAAACDVCSGVSPHQAPATTIVLPADGDLSACACAWVFAYSNGATPGRVTLTAPGGVGRLTVYGDAGGEEVIAEVPEGAVAEGIVVYSRTGVLRVDLATVAAVPALASVTVAVEAINPAPVLEVREDVPTDFLGALLQPWAESNPLLVTVRDYDLEGSLRAELDVEGILVLVRVPATAGVEFEEGSAGTASRRVVVSGPTAAVEAAVNNARLIPIAMGHPVSDRLTVRVVDRGADGEDKLESVFSSLFGVRGADGAVGWMLTLSCPAVPGGRDRCPAGRAAGQLWEECAFFRYGGDFSGA